MLLSHICEYACECAYECNLAPIRKKFVGVRKHSWGVRKHSWGLAKIRNMFLKFARKSYTQHIRKPFLLMARHCSDRKTFVKIRLHS